jgi:hypothetical protein
MAKFHKRLGLVLGVVALSALAALAASPGRQMMEGQAQMGQNMQRGGMGGGGMMMAGWWMMWPGTELEVEDIKDGAALTLTSGDAETVKLIQDHAQWMRQMWQHRQTLMSQGRMTTGMMGRGWQGRGGMMGGWWAIWQNAALAVENVKDGAKLIYTSQDPGTAKQIQAQAEWMKEAWRQREQAKAPVPEKKTPRS